MRCAGTQAGSWSSCSTQRFWGVRDCCFGRSMPTRLAGGRPTPSTTRLPRTSLFLLLFLLFAFIFLQVKNYFTVEHCVKVMNDFFCVSSPIVVLHVFLVVVSNHCPSLMSYFVFPCSTALTFVNMKHCVRARLSFTHHVLRNLLRSRCTL